VGQAASIGVNESLQPRRLMCLMGMHRSGTSLVARIAHLVGLGLGPASEMMEAKPDNPEGFWENLSITSLNDDLLAALGGRWDDPPFLEDGWEEADELDEYRSRASHLVEELFPATGSHGWKDPRMSLLLPFWKRVVPIERCLLVLRDPRSVASSLKARNGIEEEKAADLWLRYVVSAWSNDPHPATIGYDDVLAAPREAAAYIANIFGLPEPDDATLDAVSSAAKPELRHHEDDVAPSGPNMQLAVHLFGAFEAGESATPDVFAKELRMQWRTRHHLREKEDLLRQKEIEIARLKDVLGEAHLQRRSLEKQLTGVQGQLDAVTSSLGWQVYQSVARKLRAPGTRRANALLRLRGPVRRGLARVGVFQESRPPPQKLPLLVYELAPVTLPRTGAPTASIIVPVHNQEVFTHNCLRAIAQAATDTPYEVIVVDDASGPELQSALELVENLRVVRHEPNVGFLRSTNAGAAVAQGEFLVLLNNDTLVTDNWLDALVSAMRRDPAVGIAGARLLFPDGRLQDAGGIMFTDATGVNYGKWEDPSHPAYNFVRETDYCSAACLITRRDLWERVGGFDERFTPAYYEDTDYAFTVRQLGHKVVCEPRANVLHFEGGSHGTDITRGVKLSEAVNRGKFVEKWRGVLDAEHLQPGSDPLIASHRPPREVVVVVDHHVPTHDRDSGSRRMFAVITALRQLGVHVVFVPADLDRKEPYTSELQDSGVEVLFGDLDLREYLVRLEPIITMCLVSRLSTAVTHLAMVRDLFPEARLVFDTVDLTFVREKRRVALLGMEDAKGVDRLEKQELAVARVADEVWVVTDDEATTIADSIPDASVAVIPNVHDEEVMSTPFDRRRDLLFIGSFLHPPNADAVEFFVADVLPRVLSDLPEIRLYVVGNQPDERIRRLQSDSVVITGWVQDVRPYLAGCRVAVAPLTYGAGLKGKVGHTMGSGLPTVMTSVAAEGYGITDGVEAFIADDPSEFAEKVIRLYEDVSLWEAMAERGAQFIRSRYSREVMATRLADALDRARRHRRAPRTA
jgi:O-antigen biosynthesis protein